MPARTSLASLPADLTGSDVPLAGLSPEHYAVGHAAFEARSTQRGVIAAWLTERLAARDPSSVLSVGCGDGALDVQVAAALAAGRSSPLIWDGLEPHAPSSLRFLERLSAVAGVRPTARQGAAEELEPERTYDVVLAVHSLYYVRDLSEAVERLLAVLRPGGELLVLLAPLGEVNVLAGALAPHTGGSRQWWSDDLANALADGGVRAQRTPLQGLLRLDDCLDAAHEPGRAVLDFTVQAVLPDVLRTSVLDYLIGVRLPGPGLRLHHPVDAYSVSAP